MLALVSKTALHQDRDLVYLFPDAPITARVAEVAQHLEVGDPQMAQTRYPMSSKERQTNEESLPAWQAINRLGYKGRLYLAEASGEAGVVLLSYPQRPGLIGIAWWDGDWDIALLKENIKWSRTPLTLLAWATAHKTAQRFGMLLHLLNVEVRAKSN